MIGSITDIGIIIVVIILLFFGASKLPEIFRSLGKATGEFKKGQMEAEMELAKMQQAIQQQQVKPLNGQVTTREQELENKIKELEKELEELKKQKQQGGNQ